MQTADDLTDTAELLTKMIAPMLAGHPPEVQSAALADLLAMWLAGHRAADPAVQAEMREQFLQDHVALVRNLVEFADSMIDKELSRRGI